MSKFVSGILGAAALVMSLGVAQFAVGHDLSGTNAGVAATAQSNHVNRSAKADRPAGIAAAAGDKIVSQVNAANDTMIVTRIPRQHFPSDTKLSRKDLRRPVACEAPASVLTDVAQRLESGRCLT